MFLVSSCSATILKHSWNKTILTCFNWSFKWFCGIECPVLRWRVITDDISVISTILHHWSPLVLLLEWQLIFSNSHCGGSRWSINCAKRGIWLFDQTIIMPIHVIIGINPGTFSWGTKPTKPSIFYQLLV